MADQPSNATAPAPEPPAADRGMQRAAVATIVVVVVLISLRWYTDRAQPRPVELTRDTHRVELNRATRSELMQLPGVGPSRADKILAYRASKGGFQNVEDLRSVDGIGDITLLRLKPHVEVIAGEEASDEPVRLVRKPVGPSRGATAIRTKKAVPEEPLDLNRATAADLQRLPGVGLATAQLIIDARGKQPFSKLEDLRRVRGIGAKKLEQIRPYVVVKE